MKDGVGIDDGMSAMKNIATGQKLLARENRLFKDQELLPGFKIDVVLWPEQKEHYMAYLPGVDSLYIFGGTYDEIEKGNEIIAKLGAAHEVDHAKYFRLDKTGQEEISNGVMEMVENIPGTKETFKRFVREIYNRPGGDYLKVHRFHETRSKVVKDLNLPGLKDERKLNIIIGDKGQTADLYLGLVITELFAYMEMGSHPEMCDENTLRNISALELVKAANDIKSWMKGEPKMMEVLKRNGNLGQGREVPDLGKYIRPD